MRVELCTGSHPRSMEEPDLARPRPRQQATPLQRASRRALAACELCRWKKVRCDARGGHPCSICVFESVQCVLSPKRPRKSSHRHSNPRPPPRLLPGDNLALSSMAEHDTSPERNEAVTATQPQPSPVLAGFNTVADITIESPFNLEDPQNWRSNGLEQTVPPSHTSLRLSRHLASRSSSASSGPCVSDLPAWVKPLPSSMAEEDVEYLQVKGALTLPDAELLDACLRSYFQNVQPLFPIVNPFDILSIVKGTKTDDKLSLLLLQALIFVGSTWVDVRLVRRIGFLSRKAFRRSVHQKLRLLYGADYEDDRICLIQTFVLWTFWFEGPNENKDAWHWIGIALSLSRTISLHQAAPNLLLGTSMHRLRRRLWWGLVTRDTIGSFALSRSPRIMEVDHDVPMLEVDDFDFHHATDVLPGAVPSTLRQQRAHAQQCVSFVQLMHICGKIFKAAYPELESGKTAVLYSRHQLEGSDKMATKRISLNTDQLRAYEKDLELWRQGVSDELWHTTPFPPSPRAMEKAELAHRGLLAMTYYAALLNLHRPQMLPAVTVSSSIEPADRGPPDKSRAIVRFAARQITQIAMGFYEENLVESLSATCITCLIPASINHIFDMTSLDNAIRSEAYQRLEQCKAIFQAFSEQQFGGVWALHLIDYIINRLELRKQQSKVTDPSKQPASIGLGRNVDHGEVVPPNMAQDRTENTSIIDMVSSIYSSGQGSRDDSLSSNGLVGPNENDGLTSDTTTIALEPATRYPNGIFDNDLPPLALDQPLPDDLAAFLGPDLSWLDFASASDNVDGMNWTDNDPV
ncbi:fungal-specific transcription factor domain-containing protein [Exophiala viscosa]|uniref:Fungal-specific transcription factor domain-containing protein n=1 Tax=Exophiala viscosa TaxID=2486360 RepID=A0AAN6DT67_9EURO|nr:fungal-specific transcription factor domain-containing protein [Exophiala viscosa]KAI1624491.1 fungal-specific transcription factor domain-containing protein [Exophiala viscosa]